MITEFLPEVGTATKCTANKTHAPTPLRYVWHHILPKVCGGATVADNLASVCDNCHYGIHAILWMLKENNGLPPAKISHLRYTGRYAIAVQGYRAAVAAGTVALIPNEGSD